MKPSTPSDTALDDLVTVRDWLRHTVSRFNAAELVYGHGTSNALDEAAFLILRTLKLPPDELEPWLEARLTRSERAAIAATIETRIESRKPAPYLLKEAWIRGHKFYVDESVIVPRSFIGELLCDGLSGLVPNASEIGSVLDLCTGSGCLAILAALAFPNAGVIGTDIAPEALKIAEHNAATYGLQDRTSFLRGDLFAALAGETFDLIVANPPYVTAKAIEEFPPEYKAEPRTAHYGGEDGMDLVRDILAGTAKHLEPGGSLIVEVGQGRPVLEAEYPDVPFLWLDTEGSEGEVFALSAGDLGQLRKTAPR